VIYLSPSDDVADPISETQLSDFILNLHDGQSTNRKWYKQMCAVAKQ
jgi:hypothetical protein